MKRTVILLLALAYVLVACNTYNNYQTTVNVTGPFEQCTVIFVPTGRGEVRFGDRDVTVTGPATITVGNVTYNVDLSSCNASPVTTTTNHTP